jgi:hypothetical protein
VWCCVIKETQPTVHFLTSYLPSRLHFIYLFACSSASHFWVVCSPAVLFLSPPPPNNKMCTLLLFYQHLFSLHRPVTQPHFTHPTRVVRRSPYPRQHPCYPPKMSHSKPFSPLTPLITPTLHDHPRTNLVPCSLNGTDSVSCSAYATTRSGLSSTPPPGGQLRVRQDFPVPADLQANAGPAVRDAFKRAMDARSAWLAVSATFCAAILDSIGESNRLAISDPDTDTLHLSPRDIINAMTAVHGTMTGAEVDALRLPLKKKLSALADLPAHIVTFRGHLARLTTAGQAPLALDAYRLSLASLSPFPVFHQYTLLWTVANGAIGQQTFEAYAAYILGQSSNILAHSNLRPLPSLARSKGTRT